MYMQLLSKKDNSWRNILYENFKHSNTKSIVSNTKSMEPTKVVIQNYWIKKIKIKNEM